jgi:XTP/dITP diphosphohydrolase
VHTREEKLRAFGRLLDVQHRLRKECPWDKKQTMESLRPNTIEEVFELADALMRRDYHEVMKELGDVMEHVVFYALIGDEAGEFDMADVCNREADKLMFRHPFIDWNNSQGDWTIDNEPFSVSATDMTINAKGQVVYKDSEADGSQDTDKPQTAAGVEQTWEQIKQRERDGNTSVLSGVPAALPSLIKAYRIQDKARNVGFDWQKKEDVWDKVKEEMGELETELKKEDKENSTKELGDFLFSVINAARLYHLNPDNALEHTNRKFISRFGYIEQKAKEQGKSLKDMTLGEMDALWNEAKSVLKDE